MPENNYHHEEVAEIMVSAPGWGLKWGNIIILLIIASILCFSYFFNYPDVVKIPVDFSSATSASVIKPLQVNYGIDTFLIRNNASVKQGQPLIVWYDKYYTSYNSLTKLENVLIKYHNTLNQPVNKPRFLSELNHLDSRKLGAFQNAYSLLISGSFDQIDRILIDIKNWKNNWVSNAEVAGHVTLNNIISPVKTSIDPQQVVLYVQPVNTNYIAHGLITNKAYARLKIKQPAYVNINELGDRKYNAKIISISPIANHAKHDIYLELNNNKDLNLTFTGEARVLLNDKTLLHRLLNIN